MDLVKISASKIRKFMITINKLTFLIGYCTSTNSYINECWFCGSTVRKPQKFASNKYWLNHNSYHELFISQVTSFCCAAAYEEGQVNLIKIYRYISKITQKAQRSDSDPFRVMFSDIRMNFTGNYHLHER